MKFEAWRPGKTLIGFPDRPVGSYVIQNMDQFFALAKASAALADLKIKIMLTGGMGMQFEPPHITSQVNCRCVITPMPRNELPPLYQKYQIKIGSFQMQVFEECKSCKERLPFYFRQDGVYVCGDCIRRSQS